MPESNRVIWSEGMLLSPHHFQVQARYYDELVEQHCPGQRSFAWGFSELLLDENLLGMGKIAIVRARGNFADGTAFSIPDRDMPPPVLDLPSALGDAEVFLAVPLRTEGLREVGDDPTGGGGVGAGENLSRYTLSEREVQDNSTLGGGAMAVQVGQLRLRLLLAGDDRGAYSCAGIARIVEVRADGSVALERDYLPPLLACQASVVLRGFLGELEGLLTRRAEALAGRMVASGRGGSAEIQDFLLLQVVNRYQPLLAHLLTLSVYHPESFYRLCIAMAGELATFVSADQRAPTLPPYRHDDLRATFAPVMHALRESLSRVVESSAVPISLQERRYGIRVATLSDRTLLDQAMFVLAIAADLPTEDIRQRFPAQVKIGPVEEIRQLVNVQLPGIRVRPLPVAPRQIPFHSGFVYFELERVGELWARLHQSGGIAIHLGGDFPGLQIEFWAIRG